MSVWEKSVFSKAALQAGEGTDTVHHPNLINLKDFRERFCEGIMCPVPKIKDTQNV